MNKKKLVRERFRTEVFTRDKYKCRVCGASPEVLDAHHITNRNNMPNGGYVRENGITLCSECHYQAEAFLMDDLKTFAGKNYNFSPMSLYDLIDSSYQEAVEASEKL